jgi:UDP-2,4-diacetamido-2,4,6-trideoxy-beta-L-altropyranose hydrolase
MRIAIRADASVEIGTGHVMRCLTLADALHSQGAEIVFVCREQEGDLCGLIASREFDVLRLPRLPIGDALGWQLDAEQTAQALAEKWPCADWLVVDHYRLDARWESLLRSNTRKIMAIDDLADRPHDCDLLLDQNCQTNAEHRYDRLLPDSCRKLLGSSYAMLRKEFADARCKLRGRDDAVRRILVFFGGSDPTNETGKALRALDLVGHLNWRVDVVVGASNPNRHGIEQWCRERLNTIFHCQIPYIATLMAEADLALGAGGSTTWERCCLGLPAIVIAVADNQVNVAQATAEAGCISFLGKSADVSPENLAEAVRRLAENEEELHAIATRGMALVDGYGVERVGAALRRMLDENDCPLLVTLRRADTNDERSLFAWRNAPEVRTASFDDRVIAWEEHVRWFRASLRNTDRHLLIGEVDGQAVGVLRYDRTGREAEVSIYLVPGVAGKGWGGRMLHAGHEWVRHNLPAIDRITARILPANPASQKTFARAGYVPNGSIHVFDLESGG